MWWFNRGMQPRLRRRRRTRDVWKPNQALIRWSRKEAFTCQDSYAGTFIVGATGSGKTTGSGYAIAEAMLKAGYGGLIMLAKNDRAYWERLCRRTGRSKDLIRFAPDQGWCFNFLNYEATRSGRGAGMSENVVQLFLTTMELANRSKGRGGGVEDAAFWENTSRQLCRNCVDLLTLGGRDITVRDMHRLVISAPKSREQLASADWKKHSFFVECLDAAERCVKTRDQAQTFDVTLDFFLEDFVELSSKTRGVIVSTFTSMADVLQRGVLRTLLCGETNLTPEAVEDGYIIMVDMPVKEFGEVGLLAQVIWKYAFQQSIERRDVRKSPRPVFLFADEAQFFINSADMHFLSTCRSSRVANVFLTQNIPNFYAVLGGEQKGKAEVDSLLGNFCMKVLHMNSDPVTCEWSSGLIGRTRQFFINANTSQQPGDFFAAMSGYGGGPQTSAGVSESYEFEVQPSEFATLRSGGRRNRWNVDAIVFQTNKVFADTGRTWRRATFRQKF